MTAVLATALPLLLLAALVAAMFIGFPIAFTLAGVSILFAGAGVMLGSFDASLLLALPARLYGAVTNEVLVAVPLFLFMGRTLERAGLAEDLLTGLGALMGGRPGGLAIATIIVGALLAGTTGVVAADVIALGLFALPAMRKAGYRDDLACGTVCAAATLAQIIPPATVLIFLADGLSAANQRAQIDSGNFAPSSVSIGDVYAGALLPGLLLIVLYLVYVLLRARLTPDSAPALPTRPDGASLRQTISALIPTLVLIGVVLGSLLFGVATATESASLGAIAALLLAAGRGRLQPSLIREVMQATASGSAMVFTLLIGASIFSIVFRGLGGDHLVEAAFRALPGGLPLAIAATMAIVFLLGAFLDIFETIFIVVPLFAPALIKLGADPVWLGVMIALNLQTSFLIPPHGYTLAYLRSVAPEDVPTSAIWRGVLPFVAIQLSALLVLAFVPKLATALPDFLYETTAPPPERSPFGIPPGRNNPSLPPLDIITPQKR